MPRSLEASPSIIPDEPESESQRSPEFRRTVDYVEELLTPTTGDELRAVIYNELYQGAENIDERRAAIEKAGFDPRGLKNLGSKLRKQFDATKNQTDLDTVEYEPEGVGLFPLVVSEKDGRGAEHANLTIGASAELSRMMRKILAASVADDPAAAEDILYAPNVSIGREQIERFVEFMNDDPATLIETQTELIRTIPREEEVETGFKRKQYTFAARHLARYTLDRLGKRPLSKR